MFLGESHVPDLLMDRPGVRSTVPGIDHHRELAIDRTRRTGQQVQENYEERGVFQDESHVRLRVS